jgi:carbonic anhydrase
MRLTRRETLAGLGALLLAGALPRQVDAAGKTKKAAAAASAAAPAKPALTPVEEIWADLMEGNRRFVEGKPTDRNLVQTRAQLAKGQKPKVMVLGCSDSRVSPTLVFDKSLGDLFVIRTAGNLADKIALGSLEYAAEHLGSKVLVVLGHEKCGAVAAAAAGGKMESPNLSAIVRKINPALKPLREKFKGDELARLGVEANVQLVAKTIEEKSKLLGHLVEEGTLTIVKAVYRLETGEVVKLA